MLQTPDGVTIYTQEDMDNMRATHNAELAAKFEMGKTYGATNAYSTLQSKVIAFFKQEAESTMDKDDALEFYNSLAGFVGLETITSLASHYTVVVTWDDGTILGEFSEIEAYDEDGAIEEVRSNLEIEVDLNVSVSYNYDTITSTINTYDNYEDRLEFEATLED